MPNIHRKLGGKLFEKQTNAAEPQMIGAPVVVYQTPYRYVDRNIDTTVITDSYKIPIIFSSLSFLNRLCFGGMDFHLESISGPEDDTKKKQIDQALTQIKKIDKSLARIGRNKNCSTLDCVRTGALSTWSFRQAFFERVITQGEGNIYAPRLQHLPSESFNKTPTALAGQPRYQVDELLKGVVFDTQDVEAHFYQNTDSIKEPIELPADQIIYFEDKGVPGNTSMLHAVMSTVEFMKQARHDFRIACKRVGIPKEVAEVDGSVLAQMKGAGIEIEGGYQTLVTYLNNMVVGQSTNQSEVALPGTRFRYPSIPLALNPMEVEKFIESILLNHFFGKAITEQLAQAISTSGAPGKLLLDTIISGHQEVAGKPLQDMWQTDFLDLNGYDLIISFEYWNWAPVDKKADSDKHTTIFAQGGSLVNDFRAAMDLDPYTPEQLTQLFEEQNYLKRGKAPGAPAAVPPQFGGPGGQEPKAAPALPEEGGVVPPELLKKKEELKPAPLPAAR